MNMNKSIFKRTNLEYVVAYDYYRSNCTCDEDICRCTMIYNAHVDKIDIKNAIKTLFYKYNKSHSDIDKYCFDRICYALHIYDKNLYEVEVGWGYYGQEVYGVYFENEEEIFNSYCELLALNTDIEKIQYCLNLEYGYLIDRVISATSASIIKAFCNEIFLPQMEYFKKIDKKIIDEYQNRELPIAVCIKDNNKYKLIDGYHRFVANKDKEKVDIIVLE